jgi:hypothetical protein
MNLIAKAFDHVREHFPNVAIVVYNREGLWQYMDENFKSFNFNDDIDVSILEDAVDSLTDVPYIYQPQFARIRPDLLADAYKVLIGEDFIDDDRKFQYMWTNDDKLEIFHKEEWVEVDSIDFEFD